MAQGSRFPFSGILLILFGLVFLADQMHFLSSGQVIARWWPMLLVIAGALQIVEKRSVFGGVVLLVLGAVFQLSNLHVLNIHNLAQYWPVLLVALGLQIVLSARGK